MSDHSEEIREIQELVVSWNHAKDDTWPINRAILGALILAAPLLEARDCDYTMSHTSETCGNPRCRES
jgi:hypothetical protein